MAPLGAPLTLIDAIDQARSLGLRVELLAGWSRHEHSLRVSVTTIDADPTVSLWMNDTSTDELLVEREQSGPERWDYCTDLAEFRDRLLLRLHGNGSSIDVPVLPSALAIVEMHGLVEDVSLSAPARVDRKQFAKAVGALASSMPST